MSASGRKLRPGVELLEETPGSGELVQRGHVYQVRLRLQLSRGDAVRWPTPWGLIDRARLEDDGATLVSDLRLDREHFFIGLFYGVQGMRLGGTRTLRIAPHMAYGARGVPGVVPANALLIATISFIEERIVAS